ncbi:MAG TPA: aminomethyl-transferring glycine dehydrogenase subunit GcvPB [Candidatus Omnitrophota bacterium]|nr:aminomethyl-transferring glycine dehydrogenase subunit GcvPB [Candidatus Omnitrophota bacterium]HQO58450.1 aminomethyl-transferring glycine dehydrogenase subunit GcvPB [Candidatus Omnitrophota bacterium]HQP12421.1 aminomethyl-transferring glycine dehydrogenase subunit GcvPB [Candidatus Omnitrophota bacterium]
MGNHCGTFNVTGKKTGELIFEKSVPGRRGFRCPAPDIDGESALPEKYCREAPLPFPEVTELDCLRHFTGLSQKNFSVDTHFYPLGSCTMKYNPRFSEHGAKLPGFSELHPLLPQLRQGEQYAQGALQVLFDMDRFLSEITGMDAFTLQPLAGAHGELTGVMLIAAYHKAKGNNKKIILIPDSAHGTNPASATIAGFATVSIPTDDKGVMDREALKRNMTQDVAAVMLTCPNTLGLFNAGIDKIADLVHSVDGLMYYDGANLNALLGRCRPGDLGFDVVHVNLHKTFSTPHGGGGPGAGPVGVKKTLIPFLPISRVVRREDGLFALDYNAPESIGYIASFYGNFGVIVKAYAYILLLGRQGLMETSNHAVLNANYMLSRLKDVLPPAFDRTCMHECVLTAKALLSRDVHALDLAKYLIDRGFHPPTIYFPLIVKEAMMFEPTECESKEEMDRFIQALRDAVALSADDPQILKQCPSTMPVSRPDEGRAARDLNANFFQTCI